MLNNFENYTEQNKSITNVLTSIFGINFYKAKQICLIFGINSSVRAKVLKKIQIREILNYAEKNYIIDQDLYRQLNLKKKNLLEIKTYRGLRNWYGLPVRGQRTHTNHKTKKKYAKRF